MSHVVITQAFGAGFAQQAYRFALDNSSRFEPSLVGGKSAYDNTYRESLCLPNMLALEPELRSVLLARAGELASMLGVQKFVPNCVELELVAHGDGAYFRRHIDTFTGAKRDDQSERTLSAVYYFHAEPKQFSGGLLCLYPLAPSRLTLPPKIEITPQRDMLVVFPSWIPHEVTHVSCPSRSIANARLSINVWLRRERVSA